jgi:hypothetical protein
MGLQILATAGRSARGLGEKRKVWVAAASRQWAALREFFDALQSDCGNERGHLATRFSGVRSPACVRLGSGQQEGSIPRWDESSTGATGGGPAGGIIRERPGDNLQAGCFWSTLNWPQVIRIAADYRTDVLSGQHRGNAERLQGPHLPSRLCQRATDRTQKSSLSADTGPPAVDTQTQRWAAALGHLHHPGSGGSNAAQDANRANS